METNNNIENETPKTEVITIEKAAQRLRLEAQMVVNSSQQDWEKLEQIFCAYLKGAYDAGLFEGHNHVLADSVTGKPLVLDGFVDAGSGI